MFLARFFLAIIFYTCSFERHCQPRIILWKLGPFARAHDQTDSGAVPSAANWLLGMEQSQKVLSITLVLDHFWKSEQFFLQISIKNHIYFFNKVLHPHRLCFGNTKTGRLTWCATWRLDTCPTFPAWAVTTVLRSSRPGTRCASISSRIILSDQLVQASQVGSFCLISWYKQLKSDHFVWSAGISSSSRIILSDQLVQASQGGSLSLISW